MAKSGTANGNGGELMNKPWAGKRDRERGFTLIEFMVAIVVALVLLAGLVASFTQQNSEYRYRNKRIDSAQDLEFVIRFVADDIRSALVMTSSPANPVTITPSAGVGVTTDVRFTVWDENASGVPASKRAVRHYIYDAANGVLRYDRNDPAGTQPGSRILDHVTFFKVFNDSVTARGGFTGIPAPLPSINLPDPPATGVPGYTILIEVEVDAGYKEGSFVDVRGNNVGVSGHKRIWRYVQVYPRTSVQ